MQEQETLKKNRSTQDNLFKYMHTGMQYVDFNGETLVKEEKTTSVHKVQKHLEEVPKDSVKKDKEDLKANYDNFWQGFNIMKNMNINFVKTKRLEGNA